ncbi:MAG TPA: SDR family NAD(P)-dependent oxidoreductase [Puia sp.]|nr:SDR family NAD(P)-dependent oxidoreductase [Puia sp.]
MSWALIAGGSKGIGFSIAEALAKRKYNLVLVSRNMAELQSAKNTLENRFNIKAEIFECDLSSDKSAELIFVWCSTKNLEVNILCNAAGLGGSKDFLDLPIEDLRRMIRTNLESPTALILSFIPILKKNAPSYILNVGSLAGFSPIPSKSVYSSTKSAILFFSFSLRQLLKSDDISVSCLCPGPVFTKPSIEKETINQLGRAGKKMAVKVSVVGELAVQGMLDHKMIIVPGKFSSLISYLLRIVPNRLLSHIFYSHQKKNTDNRNVNQTIQ